MMKPYHVLRTIDDAGLDTYSRAFLTHVWRCGLCWRTLEAIAEQCCMSIGKASTVKRKLLADGWLEEANDGQHKGVRLHPLKFSVSYDEPISLHETEPTPDETGISHSENGVSPDETEIAYINSPLNGNINNPTPLPPSRNGAGGPVWDLSRYPEINTDAFAEAWRQWCKHRREIGEPLTQTAGNMQLGAMAELGEQRAVRAIENSIMRTWKSIHEPDNGRAGGSNRQQTRDAWYPI